MSQQTLQKRTCKQCGTYTGPFCPHEKQQMIQEEIELVNKGIAKLASSKGAN